MPDRRRRPTVPTHGGRRYLAIATICERLDVRPKTVRKWIDAGLLKASKFCGEWRVAEDDFADFEREAQYSPSAPSDTLPRPKAS